MTVQHIGVFFFAALLLAAGSVRAESSLDILHGDTSLVPSTVFDPRSKDSLISVIKRVIEEVPPAPTPLDKNVYCPEAAQIVDPLARSVGIIAVEPIDSASDLIVDGKENGCLDALSTGKALAKAFLEVFVDAIVASEINGINRKTAKAMLRAKSEGFLSAFVTETSNHCSAGPFDIFTDPAKSIAMPAASILVFLRTFVDCSGFSDTFIEAYGESLEDAVAKVASEPGDEESNAVSEAFAIAGRLCSGFHRNCCRFRSVRRLTDGGTCYCNLANSKEHVRCELVKSVFEDGSVSFEDVENGVACACSEKP